MVVGILGFGKMGEAIAKGLLNKGFKVVAYDISEGRKSLAKEMGVEALKTPLSLVSSADVIFVAVKPQVFLDAVRPMGAVPDTKVVVSVMAGVSSETIKKAMGIDRVVRVMPNTPALVGEGALAVAFCGEFSQEEKERILTLLDPLGLVVEVQEVYMDAVTALSGSGPAYVFLFLEALEDAGVRVGLPRDVARLLALQTLKGSVRLAEEGSSARDLINAVTSPGGTTIAALHVLERAGFKGIVMDAVEAAWRRSKELGKQ